MFFELRQYRVKPEKREEWVELMEKEIIPQLSATTNHIGNTSI